MTFFHFTAEKHWGSIQRDNVIRPTESNVGSPVPAWTPHGARVGPNVVWLLDDREAATQADHGLGHSALDKRAVCIAVEVPAVRWLDWAPRMHMHPRWFEFFVDSAGGMGAAGHWYVWPASIQRKFWGQVTFAADISLEGK